MASHVLPRTFLVATVLQLVLVMLLLPGWSFPGYSLVRHTTSHLGAQGAPHAWVMGLTFIGVGAASAIAVGQKLLNYRFHVVVVVGFGLSLILAGLFQHEPVGSAMNAEGRLHSLFATTTGLSFTVFAMATAFISTRRQDRLLAVAVALLAVGLSAAMAAWPEAMGLFQRLMFGACFGWLLYLTAPGYPLRP